MNKRERFKVAVLAICADMGMSLGETLTFVKYANQAVMEKQAFFGEKALGTAAMTLGLKLPIMLALATPPVAGAATGWGLARATSGINDRTSTEVKHQEMIDELRRQAERTRTQTAIAQRKKEREERRGGRGLV
jgi:hypothetical protein